MKAHSVRLLYLILISPLACTALADNAFCFDNGRFAQGSGSATAESSDQTSPFVLQPDGYEASHSAMRSHNVFSYIPASELAHTSTVVSNAKIAMLPGTRTKECGPLPLSPPAIEALVRRTASDYGVDPDLAAAVAWTESHFDETRNSPKGARGPMQLMPATAFRFGVTDICDPASNIDAGVRYLRVLLDQFKNPLLAVAAYNAGERSIYDSNGVPAYPETIRYVASVVNRQLGLAFSRKSQASRLAKRARPDPASEVMGTQGRQFIGGVMQF